MPADPTGLQKTVTKDSAGHKETFGGIAFKAAGTYNFTVTEQQGSDGTVTYDTDAKNISVTVEAGTDGNLSVTKVTIDGTEVTGDAIIGSGVTVENTVVEKTNFEFTKVWYEDDNYNKPVVWKDGQEITVTLGRSLKPGDSETETKDSSFSHTYTIKYENSAFTITKGSDTAPNLESVSLSDNKYAFKISGLEKTGKIGETGGTWVYRLKEEDVSGYVTKYGTWGEKAVIREDWKETGITTGNYVFNKLVYIELPKTGGSGTGMITILGSILILAGAGVLLLRRRGESL
jgi:pilin isopeptide linkage protein/LPXTG-motif cell wall-anchored protein